MMSCRRHVGSGVPIMLLGNDFLLFWEFCNLPLLAIGMETLTHFLLFLIT